MLRLLAALCAVLVILMPVLAKAETPFRDVDYLSLGGGYYNFDRTESHTKSVDFRGEYRWGLSLLSAANPALRSWDDYIQFHPVVGIEMNSFGLLYGNSGFDMDAYLGKHFVFTWGEQIGFLNIGQSHQMGSYLEFRSMGEIGYRFANNLRVTAYIGHISNAGLTKRNPGAEVEGIYIHIPINLMEGKSR